MHWPSRQPSGVTRKPSGRVDLAASHRVIRSQAWDRPGLFAHFRLFALVSSGRDLESGRTEAQMLRDHLGYWIAARFPSGMYD
jgi:hypothetical protein